MPSGDSPDMERAIDAEVKIIVDKAYNHCKETLTKNRALLDELTETLIEKENVDYTELQLMVAKYDPARAADQAAAQGASGAVPVA